MTPAMVEGPPFPSFLVGLDLGKSADYTAAAVVESMPRPREDCSGHANHYTVVDLLRAPLGTSYPTIVGNLKTILGSPLLRPNRAYPAEPWKRGVKVEAAPNPTLVIDATGVGSPVVDMVLAAGMPAGTVPITITASGGPRRDAWPGPRAVAGYWVAKVDLVSAAVALMQSKRLEVAADLDLGPTLQAELETFEVRVTRASNEQFSHRVGDHDDLVLAVCLAVWFAEYRFLDAPVDRRLHIATVARDGRPSGRPMRPGEYEAWARKYRG